MNKLALAALLVALTAPGTKSSIFTISDDRVRDMDIAPVLGRGYSIMTNMYQSTCLMVDETTVPSYDYDYFFTDRTSSSSDESAMSGSISGSFSSPIVSAAMSTSMSSTSKVKTETRFIAATMRIERYYSSVREEVSPLSSDASQLLAEEDYVGFFKSCGPNYVRGIRRAQEITAMFQFKSSSKENASSYSAAMAGSLQTPLFGGSAVAITAGRSKFKSVNSSLTISIIGYGLGLNQEGSETLVATTLEEYQQVMKFAFRSMTMLKDSKHIGMIYGIEVVPWVHNTAFQVAAKLGEENILIPMARSLIPKAIPRLDPTGTPVTTSSWTTATRADFRCKTDSLSIDKFGYCCEPTQMWDAAGAIYRTVTNFDGLTDACRPLRALDKSLVKDNMSNNGEFVARLDSAMRYKLVSIGTLEKCISAANGIPDMYNFHFLKAQDSVKYGTKTFETDALEFNFFGDKTWIRSVGITLIELKLAIDPKADYSLMEHMGKELDEWIEMFFSPCLAALFGTNVGQTPGVEASFFMAYPWHSHPECMHLSCLVNIMRWDRNAGGCVPGLSAGPDTAAPYTPTSGVSDRYCAKDGDSMIAANEVCKHNQAGIVSLFNDLKGTTPGSTSKCWDTLKIKNVDYFISNYCMPQLTKYHYPDNPEDWFLDMLVENYSKNMVDERNNLGELYARCNSRYTYNSIATRRQLSSTDVGIEDYFPKEDSARDEMIEKLKKKVKAVVEEDAAEDFVSNLKKRIESSRKK